MIACLKLAEVTSYRLNWTLTLFHCNILTDLVTLNTNGYPPRHSAEVQSQEFWSWSPKTTWPLPKHDSLTQCESVKRQELLLWIEVFGENPVGLANPQWQVKTTNKLIAPTFILISIILLLNSTYLVQGHTFNFYTLVQKYLENKRRI